MDSSLDLVLETDDLGLFLDLVSMKRLQSGYVSGTVSAAQVAG